MGGFGLAALPASTTKESFFCNKIATIALVVSRYLRHRQTTTQRTFAIAVKAFSCTSPTVTTATMMERERRAAAHPTATPTSKAKAKANKQSKHKVIPLGSREQ